MREDMSKLLVERPRRRGSKKRNRRHPLNAPLSRDGEDVSKLSMKKSWISHKELNENLAPLDRYLRSQVGRLWDDVYSDICQHLNRNSAVQYHVFQHLAHMVDLDLIWWTGKSAALRGMAHRPGNCTSTRRRDVCAVRIVSRPFDARIRTPMFTSARRIPWCSTIELKASGTRSR